VSVVVTVHGSEGTVLIDYQWQTVTGVGAGGGAAGGVAIVMGLHIFVRDLLTGTWVLQDPMRWADAYPGRIATALAVFISTGGGALELTGTAEAGRVTVINPAGMAAADVGWMSMSDTEMAAAGIPLSGG
jgi:hypothetical protein